MVGIAPGLEQSAFEYVLLCSFVATNDMVRKPVRSNTRTIGMIDLEFIAFIIIIIITPVKRHPRNRSGLVKNELIYSSSEAESRIEKFSTSLTLRSNDKSIVKP